MNDNISKETTATTPVDNSIYIKMTSGLKMKDYTGYALGDVGSLLVFSLVISLLQKFYTDIFAIGPIAIMIIMTSARLWDAINDPIMGRIIDTSKVGKNGRYRPWLIRMSIPLAISAILMFIKWPGFGDSPDQASTIAYATITYILFGMCYTAVNIPYGSLASVVTTDEGERNKLSIFRSVGSGIGGLPVMIVASFCYANRLDGAGNKILGENGAPIQDMLYNPVIIGVCVLALLSVFAFWGCYKLSKERVKTLPALHIEKGTTKKIIKLLLGNRAFISLSMAAMLLLAAQMFTQSYYLYLFDDYFGKSWMNLVAVACTYAPMVVLMFVTPKLIRKFGKKEICAAGMVLAALSNLLLFILQLPPELYWLFLIFCFLSGIGQTFLVLQIWSLVTDAIDDLEVNTGMREDGTAYAAFMFFRKFGQMIAAIAVNGALIAMNYKYYKGAVQTQSALKVMYNMATLIPAIIFIIAAIILFLWYPLSKKKTIELQSQKAEMLKEMLSNNDTKE
ncbi:MAG: glycoside-pentoside-hexuronide (GPH):cation symporter [Clostridia bacterium]